MYVLRRTTLHSTTTMLKQIGLNSQWESKWISSPLTAFFSSLSLLASLSANQLILSRSLPPPLSLSLCSAALLSGPVAAAGWGGWCCQGVHLCAPLEYRRGSTWWDDVLVFSHTSRHSSSSSAAVHRQLTTNSQETCRDYETLYLHHGCRSCASSEVRHVSVLVRTLDYRLCCCGMDLGECSSLSWSCCCSVSTRHLQASVWRPAI